MRRCARRLLPWHVVWQLITALTCKVLPVTWRRWLTRSRARHGRCRIGIWLVCCGMLPSVLKQAEADLVGLFAAHAMVEQPTCADEHQAIDQALGAWRCYGPVHQQEAALVSIGQVPGDVRSITRGAGDQSIERGAPGVHRSGSQVDVLDRRLKARHGCTPLRRRVARRRASCRASGRFHGRCRGGL